MENNDLKENIQKSLKEKIAISNIKNEFDMKNKNYTKVAYEILSLCAILILCIVISSKVNFQLNINDNVKVSKNNNVVQENDIELNINNAKEILKDDTENVLIKFKPIDSSMIPNILKNLKIPEDCDDTSYCQVFEPKEVLADYNKEEREIDYNTLSGYECNYLSKDIGRSIKIAVHKEVNTNNKLEPTIEYGSIPSKINNVELFIYNYDVEPCINPKYDKNSYYVLFNYKEYGFSISTKYITEEELVNLLKSIIK